MIRLGLATECSRRHMSDESWQIFYGLYQHGYTLCGYKVMDGLKECAGYSNISSVLNSCNETNVQRILDHYKPSIVVVQDKREWDHGSKEKKSYFTNHRALADHECFKLTILKDAHQRPEYHKALAKEMDVHAHIIYYDEESVRTQASWLKGPVIRTYHTIDKSQVPPFSDRLGVSILSGAISRAYPLRSALVSSIGSLPDGTRYLPHPGYNNTRCYTPTYLKELSKYRVAICTCSIYNYALRKLIEATACGCIVVTNLPRRYSLPLIDENLVRISDNATISEVKWIIKHLYSSYNPEKQKRFSDMAKQYYDYRAETQRLVTNIDNLAVRLGYA